MSSPSYEVHYFPSPGRADLQRMMLDVTGAQYKNVFLYYMTTWPEVKETMPFGMVPKLVVLESDGSRKVRHYELVECVAIETYLAEVLDLVPGTGTAFDRAEALSVLSSLSELEDKLRPSLWLPTLEARKTGHTTYCTETVPKYLKYHERFVSGDWYFGDKMTVADLKLYQLYLWYEDMYATVGQNPFKVLAADFPKLNKIVTALDKGKAGTYARSRREFGALIWSAEQWISVPQRT
ncbi:hypothetical protein EXIGLDRAFT_755777 [Exidia glandulosa HHB12029]|uniref:Glutathione S-transferase n=1 Tax=Exidia glandulosa HHB12029 TaxID=1314781 RepID=A0A165BRP3_EXIGL|nr:hypothetical protein EXIGLDRAFT_755777 [Exidia glandulosa HHB12029]